MIEFQVCIGCACVRACVEGMYAYMSLIYVSVDSCIDHLYF